MLSVLLPTDETVIVPQVLRPGFTAYLLNVEKDMKMNMRCKP